MNHTERAEKEARNGQYTKANVHANIAIAKELKRIADALEKIREHGISTYEQNGPGL